MLLTQIISWKLYKENSSAVENEEGESLSMQITQMDSNILVTVA